MMVYILCRWDHEGECCFNETARLTKEEAETFIAQQTRPDEWSVDPIDLVLVERVAEPGAVTSRG